MGTGKTSGATSARLLARAQGGDRSALNALVERHLRPLQRWAHGRLPAWARACVDTADLVQDALMNTIRRLDRFEPRGHGALRGYLCRAVDNRIHDELRQVARRRPAAVIDDTLADGGPSPLEQTIAADAEDRYRRALARLRPADQRLVVGRVELGYNFEQLALMSNKRRADSARIALHRALVRLGEEMTRV